MTKKTIAAEIVSPFLDTDCAASYLLISAQTLKNHRALGTGPNYRRHGGRVVYHREDLDEWSDERSTRRQKKTAKGEV